VVGVQRSRQVEPNVLVVGSTMTDMIAYARVLPDAGETVVGESFALGFGGKGANQAVMCALLGASVTFVGCLGRDVFGEMTLENFESFGIDTSLVTRTDAAASGAAPIWVDASGENRIIVVPGANDLLEPAVVEAAVRERRADVVLCQLEVPEACVKTALKTARESGGIAVLNPAPMTELGLGILSLASWLIPNSSELEAIARRLELSLDGSRAELAQSVGAQLGADMVVTLGGDGALIYEHEDGSVVTVPAPPADPIDTTGAGDAFVGAFAYALACGTAARDAAAFGCACASASVEARGTQTSFPRGDRLTEVKRTLSLAIAGGARSPDTTRTREEAYGT
jgi:ribokinase